MKVHLVDGTYELFRCYFGAPSSRNAAGKEVGATRGLLRSLASWLRSGEVTHAAYAFDHVIESFRNDLFDGYKTGEGLDPDLFGQFELAERAVAALGLTVWPMIDFEADDAVATAAIRFADAPKVDQVLICSPDKDLAQCVRGDTIVMYDRFRKEIMNEPAVIKKFGVKPRSIPDLLALTGDTADGIPGIDRWGMKSASTVLAEYESLEKIPADHKSWRAAVRGAEALSRNLNQERDLAELYRKLATLRLDVPLKESLPDLAWKGAHRAELTAICEEIGSMSLLEQIDRWC